MNLKILLIGINARYTHANLAIRYLRNLEIELETEIAEYTINQSQLEILQDIFFRKPDVIGFSVYIWNTDLVKQLLPEIKKILPSCRLLLGGPEVSYNPQAWIAQFPAIDHIIIGSGEAGYRFLAEKDFLWNERIVALPNPPFSELPFPYREDDFPEMQNKYVYYESSRGCGFRCSYCLSSRSDQKLEFRDLAQVKKELNWLLQKKPKIIKFVDRTYNFKPAFAREIWQFLIDKNTETRFHFEIFPGILEEADFKVLGNCPPGRFQFEIGIQSANPQTLQEIHRFQEWKIVKENIHRLRQLGTIHLHVDLIAGLPFEDRDSLIRSFNDIISLESEHCQIGFLKILPGTEMRKKTENYGLVYQQNPPYRILRNKWLKAEDLFLFQDIERLVNAVYNSEKLRTTYLHLNREFENPFAFFLALLLFCREQKHELHWRDWKIVARMLQAFVEKSFEARSLFYLDCLRWDWCHIAAGHFYPDFLADQNTQDWGRIGLETLKTGQAGEFRASQIKRTSFFKAISEEFRQKMNLADSIYALVPFAEGKTKLELIALPRLADQDLPES